MMNGEIRYNEYKKGWLSLMSTLEESPIAQRLGNGPKIV
jgi:hypothetical protein